MASPLKTREVAPIDGRPPLLTFLIECECQCGESIPASDVRGRPRRFARGHERRKPFSYTVDSSGCWVWDHGLTADGYGRHRGEYAHRVSYERTHGPIPAGLEVDHLCRNRACVRPTHLEAVTHRENGLRGKRTILADEQVRAIREDRRPARVIGAEYGVSAGYVYLVRNGHKRGAA